ncbi:hypothetical protein MNV84_05583 [Leishmania braziliensis]|nr:hypothetical protein MNV84_05583 [Leishmania braziliensis]
MEYVLGVLYATKRYEPFHTSGAHPGASSLQHTQALLLHSGTFAMNSLAGVPVVPDAAGTESDNDNDDTAATWEDLPTPTAGNNRRSQVMFVFPTAKDAPVVKEAKAIKTTSPFRHGGSVEGEPLSPPLPLRALTSGVDRAPTMTLPSYLSGSRRRSLSLTAGGMQLLPSAAAAGDQTLSFPREGAALSPLVLGLSTPLNASDAVQNATGGGGAGVAAVGRPAVRPQRLEHIVPTKAIAGKYVLLYLPSPHRHGEASAAALWGSTGSAAAISPGGAAGGGGSAGPSGARAHQTSAVLQSPQMDLSKPRLGASTPSSSYFMASVSPHAMSTSGGRASFSTPLNKSVESSSSTSTATVGGHHLSNHHISPGGAGSGSGAAARQAVVCAAAAAASTQQKLLLFYCLLLHYLAHQSPAQERTIGMSFLESRTELDTAAVGPVPVAVLELQYTTEGPVRSNAGGILGTSTLGGSGNVSAAADGHGGTVSVSPGSTAGGGGGAGGSASPPPSGNRTFAYSPAPASLSTHSVSEGARGGLMPPSASFGGSGYLSITPSVMASPRSSSAAHLFPNAGDPFVTQPEACADEDSATAATALRELLRGSLDNSDAVAAQRLSSVLRHLLDGQPDVWFNPDNISFDSELTQNPYYGGWYSVESNDGYRRVMQICNIQSWPAVVLVDPAGNVVTVEALKYMEDELARYVDEVDASIAKASVAHAAVSTAFPIEAAASLDVSAGDASTFAAVRASVSVSSTSPHTSEVSQQASALRTFPQDEASINGLGVAEKSPLSPQLRVSRVTESQAASPSPTTTLFPDGTTVTDHSNTNPLEVPVELAVDDGDKATSGLVGMPEGRSMSLSGSICRYESSFSVHDPQIPTAEPTPVKAAPTTARYVEESSAYSAPSITTPATASISAVTVSPLLPNTSMSSNGFSAGTRQSIMSPGRGEVRDNQDDERGMGTEERALGIAATSRAAFRDESSNTRQRSGGICEKSTSLMAKPLAPPLSMPALQRSESTATPPAAFSLAKVCMTKGHTSFPSWDPKAYGGDVAGVLAVSDMDSEMDLLTGLGKTQTSRTHTSEGAAPSAAGEEEAKNWAPTIQVPLAPAVPLANAVTSRVVAHVKTAEGFIAATPGTPPTPPSPSPAPLPVFSSAFPWNRVLAEPLMAYQPPSLMTTSVGTATSVDSRRVKESAPQRDKTDSSPPLPSLRLLSRRATATASLGERRCGDGEDFREGLSGFDRTTGLSSAGAAGARHLAVPPRTHAAAAMAPLSMVHRQVGRSSTPASMSVSGVPEAAVACEPESGAMSHNSLFLQSGEVRGAAALQLEPTTLADSSALTWSGLRLPIDPLHRLAFCTVTVSEVRERARQSSNNTVLSSSELGKTNEQPLVAPLTQGAVCQSLQAASNESLVFPSLSLANSIDNANARRLAASHGLPSQPQLPLPTTQVPPLPSLLDTASQQIIEKLLEKWPREAAVKFSLCTHLLIVFGAGWHPGMAKFVRAVRHLCSTINEPAYASPGAPDFRKRRGSDGDDAGGLRGGLGGLNIRGLNSQLSTEDDAVAPFASWKGFSNSSIDWTSGGVGDFAGGFGEASSRFEMRSFTSFTRADADGSNVSEEGERMRSACTLNEAAAVVDKSTAPDTTPRRRVQVIYISADESLQAVCSAMADMPGDWLCVSPYVAQSVPERQLQEHASDMARHIFHVKSFPRMVVVEMPYGQQQQQQQQQQPANAECTGAVHTGDISAGGRGDVEGELGDAVGTLMTLYDIGSISQPASEQRHGGLWTVVQLHGEMHLYTDPEGKEFPWPSESARTRRTKQEDIPALLRWKQQACASLVSGFRQKQQRALPHTGLSLHPSPMLGSSNPDGLEDAMPLHFHTERLTVSDTPTKVTAIEADVLVSTADTVSLHPPVARLFPPIKPFLVADGELPSLLERGGYFVVLGAFGSVDRQLHQQCFNALDEVRQWLYAEVEARKQSAWSELTQLQAVVSYGPYTTPFSVDGDRVTSSPAAFHPNTGGNVGMDEYTLPTRYSSGITAAAPLSIAPGGGDPDSAAALHGLGHGTFSNRSDSTPMAFEDGWPESRGGTSPKLAASSPPAPGRLSLQLDAPTGVHGIHVGGAPSLASAAATHKPIAAARPLPTVYFYDSILSHPPAPDSPPPATAARNTSGVPGGGGQDANKEVGLEAKPAPLSHTSLAPTGTPAKALPRQCGNDAENAVATAAFSPSPAPTPCVADNTSALRRHHARDLALLQEYIIAPILEVDERQLPVREGELYLACVRWPQRTSAVLRRCLTSEARPTAAALAVPSGSTAGLPAGSTSSSAAGSSFGGGLASPSSGSNSALRSLTASQSLGQTQPLPEVILRRSSTPTDASPSPSSPMTALVLGSVSAAAITGSSDGSSHLLPPTTAPAALPSSSSAVADSVGASASGTNTGLNSPPLGATLSNHTMLMEEECKEGSPYPDATPLASAEAIKSFLYDNILRLMEA